MRLITNNTIMAYDNNARKYEFETKDFLSKYLVGEINLFLSKLSGKNILDLGSGPGRDSKYFLDKGFNPTCLDYSRELLKLCQNKNLKTIYMDINNLLLEENSFDGVWAYTSLLHIQKNNIEKVLNDVSKILKPKGYFFVSIKEGIGERIKKDRFENESRFFAFYLNDEFEDLLIKNNFKMVKKRKLECDKEHIYIEYLCQNN